MSNDPISLEFIKWLWGLLSIPLWFLFKKTGEASKDLAEHKLYAANTYVKNTDIIYLFIVFYIVVSDYLLLIQYYDY